MARFEDFTQRERHILREAMAWSQSEFYDPGHTEEDRATLQALITEAKITEATAKETNAEAQKRPTDAPGCEAIQEPADTRQSTAEATAAPRMYPFYMTPKEDGQTDSKTPTPTSGRERTQLAQEPEQYKGFLIIKCDHCGNVHAFCAKLPMSVYRCKECGQRTPLTDMHHLRLICECGARFSYTTNITEKQTDITCFKCGAPVVVEWNEKLQKYTTIGAMRRR